MQRPNSLSVRYRGFEQVSARVHKRNPRIATRRLRYMQRGFRLSFRFHSLKQVRPAKHEPEFRTIIQRLGHGQQRLSVHRKSFYNGHTHKGHSVGITTRDRLILQQERRARMASPSEHMPALDIRHDTQSDETKRYEEIPSVRQS